MYSSSGTVEEITPHLPQAHRPPAALPPERPAHRPPAALPPERPAHRPPSALPPERPVRTLAAWRGMKSKLCNRTSNGRYRLNKFCFHQPVCSFCTQSLVAQPGSWMSFSTLQTADCLESTLFWIESYGKYSGLIV